MECSRLGTSETQSPPIYQSEVEARTVVCLPNMVRFRRYHLRPIPRGLASPPGILPWNIPLIMNSLLLTRPGGTSVFGLRSVIETPLINQKFSTPPATSMTLGLRERDLPQAKLDSVRTSISNASVAQPVTPSNFDGLTVRESSI